MFARTSAPRRFGHLGSIRLPLILLTLVPSVTLAVMWGVTTNRMFSEGLELRSQTRLSRATGAMGTDAALALQRERGVSAAWLASPGGSRTELEKRRAETDAAVAELVGESEAIRQAPARVSQRLSSVLGSLDHLEHYRQQVDEPTDITAEQALDHYSSIIDEQIHAFHELSQVDDGDLTSQAGPLVALEHAAELTAQEDALLTLAWPSGRFDEAEWAAFSQAVHTRRWLVRDQILPSLHGAAKTRVEAILAGDAWKTVESVEDQVLAARATGGGRAIRLPDAGERWTAAFDEVSLRYSALIEDQTTALLDSSAEEARGLLFTAGWLSAGGLLALLLCAVVSWRITRSLSQRLTGLREATLSLAEERLPDVVARLQRGETVDVESATPPLDYGRDELGQVAQAFNAAQRTAVHTAVELADTRRGFQKVILGIARQSQNLVNMQLGKLDALERAHTDPEVLKGLYELDSVAAQLRRYEENLVVISGEQPRRSWREPVALIDILRGAVGEVAEYQRVEVSTECVGDEEEVYLAPPAVADVIHLLAELIDNATAYSPAPAPVGVRASMAAKGLVVEIEDRGLGLSEEDYASFNAQLAVEPQFDVVALAGDLRLGMFVVARLAHRHGITVTLRPSPYGGTTAIVLVPHEIVVRELPAAPDPATPAPAPATAPSSPVATAPPAPPAPFADPAAPQSAPQAAQAPQTPQAPSPAADPTPPTPTTSTATPAPAHTPDPDPAQPPSPATPRPASGSPSPLPRRVPQTSLAAELREEPPGYPGTPGTPGAAGTPDGTGGTVAAPEDDDGYPDFTAERAAASLAGFQRGTLQARDEGPEERDGRSPGPARRPLTKDTP